MSRSLLYLLLSLFVLTPTFAEAPSAQDLLLRVDWDYQDERPTLTSRSEMLIYHDGLYLDSKLYSNGSRSYYRATVRPETIQALRDALTNNRVGFAEGGCGLDFSVLYESHSFSITWFGKFPRQHTFEVRTPGGPPCSAETQALWDAFWKFRIAALILFDPQGTRVGIPSPRPMCPAPGAEVSGRKVSFNWKAKDPESPGERTS